MRLPEPFTKVTVARLTTAIGDTFTVGRGEQEDNDGEPIASLILTGGDPLYQVTEESNNVGAFNATVALQCSVSRLTEEQLWSYFNPVNDVMEDVGWYQEEFEYMIDPESSKLTRVLIMKYRMLSNVAAEIFE